MNIPEITDGLSKNELWRQTVKALDAGDFTWLDKLLSSQNVSLVMLLEANGEPKDCMEEGFAFACMVGRTAEAETLLDRGVDPYAGMKTGLSGFHYAVSSGRLETVKMLVDRRIRMNVENMYGGTVWGQALWSAVHEHKESHAEIIAALIEAGAEVETGTLDWWKQQDIPSDRTKRTVEGLLLKKESND
ncbi:MAG: ankyrin repeat domain-containing protein [Blastocatellia bacterium]